ncbi:hypothetical protein GCM10009092_10110 [Bowmanella denitrificans]|uniref:DUF1304 domain-containing protein n=1 Tax=Bowmanella denitrificans TaxID=366582 RepID=A0ABP3GNM3_9ALTE
MTVVFMLASASIMFLLGAVHLAYTFWGPKLTPRDDELKHAMARVSPVITQETTMWNAWLGFNASHSLGAMLFGLVFGYLSLKGQPLLFQADFLPSVGLIMLCGYVVLGKLYWFRIPSTGILLALLCFIASMLIR